MQGALKAVKCGSTVLSKHMSKLLLSFPPPQLIDSLATSGGRGGHIPNHISDLSTQYAHKDSKAQTCEPVNHLQQMIIIAENTKTIIS